MDGKISLSFIFSHRTLTLLHIYTHIHTLFSLLFLSPNFSHTPFPPSPSPQTAAEKEVYQQRVAELLKENETLRERVSELEAMNKRLRSSADLVIHNKFD